MQLLHTPNKQPNLISQIQLVKNYNEHRRRLGITRYKSPLSLKKSLSFDQEKSIMFNDLKSRKTYTNDFLKKQKTRQQEQTDAIMLSKILEYDRKIFVFSLNQEAVPSALASTLHHNSRVAQDRTFNKIDSENEKIHFRITKAKSKYGKDQLKTFRQSPSASTFLMRRQHSQNKINHRNSSAKKMYTETELQNEEEGLIINKIPQLAQAKKIRDQVLRVQTSKSRLSQRANATATAMSHGGKLFTLSGNNVCDRIRKERLASKLYERKLRFQNTVGSTFHRRKER